MTRSSSSGQLSPYPCDRRVGFTLVELILAIFLASGLLTGVLSFYQQSARLREELQKDVEEVSRVRLLFETLSRELPSAMAAPGVAELGLRGGADWIEFAIPAAVMPLQEFAVEPRALPDLLRVRYRPSSPSSGLVEESSRSPASGELNVEDRGAGNGSGVGGQLTAGRDVRLGAGRLGVERVEHQVFGQRVDEIPLTVPILDANEGRLRFRYFTGGAWSGEWDGPGLPHGVEISFAFDSLPMDRVGEGTSDPLTTSSDAQGLFRRVVFLPASEPDSVALSAPVSSPAEMAR